MKIKHLLTVLLMISAASACLQEKNDSTTEPVSAEIGWGLVGGVVNNPWADDIPMIKEDEWYVAKGVQFTSLSFKIRAGEKWFDATNIGLSPETASRYINERLPVITTEDAMRDFGTYASDINLIGKAGTYDVYFSRERMEVYVMEEGFKPGERGSLGPLGDLNHELYVLGDASDASWRLDLMKPFTTDDGIYTWTGTLRAGRRYRFPLQRDWWPSLCLSEDGTTVEYRNSDSEETVYYVPKDAVYTITLDLRDWNNRSATVECTDEMGSPLPISELYVIGDASDASWSLNKMTAFTDNNGIWTWSGYLRANRRYRFPLQKEYWPSLCLSEDGTMVEYKKNDSEETVYFVPEDGTYLIMLDLRKWATRSAIVKKIGK